MAASGRIRALGRTWNDQSHARPQKGLAWDCPGCYRHGIISHRSTEFFPTSVPINTEFFPTCSLATSTVGRISE